MAGMKGAEQFGLWGPNPNNRGYPPAAATAAHAKAAAYSDPALARHGLLGARSLCLSPSSLNFLLGDFKHRLGPL